MNTELEWSCRICEMLGVLDPLEFLNNVDPKVFDLWVAYMVKKSHGR